MLTAKAFSQPVPLTDWSRRRYLTYPHCNGFASGGRTLVVGQQDRDATSLWEVDLETGYERCLHRFPVAATSDWRARAPVWFDVSPASPFMAVSLPDSLWLLDLSQDGPPKLLFSAPAGTSLGIPSLFPDGDGVLTSMYTAGSGAALTVRADGSSGVLFEHPWYANHHHFSPRDPRWVAYCHEGPATEIDDRTWAWHGELAANGRCIMDQTTVPPGPTLRVGHERACFHDLSVLTCAFGDSRAPSGLWEAYFDGRQPRLVSAAKRDWHCNVSSDGCWAVVDTTGPHDAPGSQWDNAGNRSDVLLVDMETGSRQLLARSHQISHPWHPHPAFSPDGNTIVFNDVTGPGPWPEGAAPNPALAWSQTDLLQVIGL